MALSGELFTRDEDGHPLRDDAFLIVLHRGEAPVDVLLPKTPYGDAYRRLLDTSMPRPGTDLPTEKVGTRATVQGRSVTLFRVEHD